MATGTLETLEMVEPGVYRALSTSREGGEYKVQVANGEAVCSCPGYETHGHCWHASQALAMEEERSTPRSMALAPMRVQPPQRTLPSRDEIGVMGTLAKSVTQTPGYAVPKDLDHPAKAFAVMLAGWELGLRPMTALRHVFVVNGRTEPDAQVMMGIVMDGDPTARFEFEERTAERCVVTLHRAGRSPIRSEYTMEDATKSGQTKTRIRDGREIQGPWQLYPRDMLAWSAVKRACRLGAPDLINRVGAGVEVADATPMLEAAQAEPVPGIEEPRQTEATVSAVEGASRAFDRAEAEARRWRGGQSDPPPAVDTVTGEVLEGEVVGPAQAAEPPSESVQSEGGTVFCQFDADPPCAKRLSNRDLIAASQKEFGGAVLCSAHQAVVRANRAKKDA